MSRLVQDIAIALILVDVYLRKVRPIPKKLPTDKTFAGPPQRDWIIQCLIQYYLTVLVLKEQEN